MRTNHVKAALRAGRASIGTWLSLPDPFAAGFLAPAGFDWLNVDMEHSPTNWETAALIFAAVARGGAVPLIRVPWNSGENIKRALDNGAWGIVVPMVNSRAEAEAAVAAATYPLRGNRSVGGGLHALGFETDSATYYSRADDEILVVIQAEHIQAVEQADDILSVPGIDAVFIGPNDLSASMGIPPAMESDDPRVVEAIDHVRKTAQKHNVAPGIHVGSAAAANQRLEEGFRFIALASELRLMQAAAQSELAALKWEPNRGVADGEAARY